MEEQMKTTVDIYDMKKRFIELDRDYYTFDGLEALLDYYDQVDENMEFDPIAICCDCTEYGDGKMVNAVLSFDDLVNDYGYLYPSEEWLEDNGAELDKDLYVDSLVKRLEDKTTVLHLPNGNYIVFAF